jgi:phosphoribosylamine--glycine ligase/phosphoribosylaminoimidazole synthetase
MKVLILGSGGREHAIAWKARQSPHLEQLFIAPGNAGMEELATLVALAVEDGPGILAFVERSKIDLVVIGPEAALAAGVSDTLAAHGVAVFGPSQAAARIETSKTFAKQFMQRHAIPTARFAVFSSFEPACEYLRAQPHPVVIKASGLAAGKGVILPNSLEEGLAALKEMMLDLKYGNAGGEVVIEERLEGEEVSLLAFCDGKTLAVMPPAQDHKRLLDLDEGPNTGGMGAFAPAAVLSQEAVAEITRTILQPAVDGLCSEGLPFVGVLYAGLILTAEGPKVLEFNARFGDPETQVILPLLESDLLDILDACARGALDRVKVEWAAQRAAVCVVAASDGYPAKAQTGFPIFGLDAPLADGAIFHAGVGKAGQHLVNAGGRVLGVTCWDRTLQAAIDHAYQALAQISFQGMRFRLDIGQKGLRHINLSTAYHAAGVDIDAGNKAVELMKTVVRSTYNSRVLAGIGSFGGLFDAADLGEAPVLVASTDGVGTKVELAARLGRYQGVGKDIVNHCINDILVQGARPLFFLDYFATARLDPGVAAEIVTGMAQACLAAGCVLLGGETAEMPGVYLPGAFDVAGTMVGIVQRDQILPDHVRMKAGDLLVGFASSGPHTNGFSLIRKICEGHDLLEYRPELQSSLADALLAPHRSYLKLVLQARACIKGLAHITGGGFIENIPRMLPDGLQARINRGAWPVPPLFTWLQEQGKIEPQEMLRVFNMGIGLVAVVKRSDLVDLQNLVNEPSWVIGELVSGRRTRVILE